MSLLAHAADPMPTSRGPVLALDLGGTHLRTAVVTTDGTLIGRRHSRTRRTDGADAVVAQAADQLRASRAEHLAAGGAVPLALGISAPGPLDPRTGVIHDPPNMGRTFWGLPLAPRLGEAVGLPWAIGLDVHVAVLGEHAFGAGMGFADLVYFTVSTGVGGAVVSGGRLMRGPDGVAGELGHLVVDMDGPVCGCGAKGHLERLTSGTGMARTASEALEDGADAPALRAIAERIAPEPIEGRHVSEAAEAGDPVANAIVERAIAAFAAACVSVTDVFDPDRIIVGGGIAMAWGDRLLEPARQAIAATAYRIQRARVQVVPASLGDDCGLIGCVPLVALSLAADPALAETTSPDAPSRAPIGAGAH